MYHLASCIAAVAIAGKLFDLPWYTALAGGTIAYLFTGGWKWMRIIYLTLGRDFRLGKKIFGIEMLIRSLVKDNKVLTDVFAETVKKHPKKIAFIQVETGEKITFEEAEELLNKIANVFQDAGFKKGDVVALLMENTIQYIPIWLGLTKLGVTVSLLNFNLRGDGLKHCISVADCKAVIYTPSLGVKLQEIASSLDVKYYIYGEEEGLLENAMCLKKLLSSASSLPPVVLSPPSITDKLIYIYTSGTTGLPKAAVIRGSRFTAMSYGMSALIGSTGADILYNCLPLYHSSGGVVLSGQMIFRGNTVVTRQKFSASKLFEDCRKYDATIFNYIGETCRYLLAQPPGEFDRKHSVRMALGNGIRSSIWKEFQDRFNIGTIVEFYGATEGNANVVNNVGKVGSVGYNSVLLPWVYPIRLVRVDKTTGELIRGPDGLSIPCKPGELGEMVGKVKTDALHKFDGYVNPSATKKKIAYDIFSKGDSAFMSGDVLIQDELGFFYFQDRTGDTFRWKGENVSTNEVEGVISKVLQLNDVCVYGVEVPGIEGKAGMACISDPDSKINMETLHGLISVSLPPYACPVFIRTTEKELDKTTTYKFKKANLRKEAFNLVECPGDRLFYFNGKEKKFQEIDNDIYSQIQSKAIRF